MNTIYTRHTDEDAVLQSLGLEPPTEAARRRVLKAFWKWFDDQFSDTEQQEKEGDTLHKQK